MRVICAFACRVSPGTLYFRAYQIYFAVQVYDLNGDGFVTREEMLQWLKTSLIRQSHEDDSDEGVKELIDIIIKKLDCVDHDNRVSLKVSEESQRIEQIDEHIFDRRGGGRGGMSG